MSNKKTWCPLPWNHVSVKSNGTFRICCHGGTNLKTNRATLADDNGVPYHIRNTNWDEARNSQLLKEVRLAQLNGEWHEACTRCKHEFESGMDARFTVEREIWRNDVDYEKAKELTNEDGSINPDDFEINYLDVRFGNLCNLKCIMCSPTDSSQWYTDQAKVWNTTSFKDTHGEVQMEKRGTKWKPIDDVYDWHSNPNVWEEIERHKEQFRKIYIVGGEPLIIETHYDFLEKCIEDDIAKNIALEYNSNVVNVPQRALDLWPHFKEVRMGISIDATGERNNHIRFPSKWNKIVENMHKLDALEGDHYIFWITASISVLNLWHMPEFMDWKIKQNFKKINNIEWWKQKRIFNPHPVHRPPYLNMQLLPAKAKTRVKEYFQLCINQANYGPEFDDEYKYHLNNYLTYMNKADQSEYIPKFLEYMNKMDSIRNTNWRQTFPEVWDLIRL